MPERDNAAPAAPHAAPAATLDEVAPAATLDEVAPAATLDEVAPAPTLDEVAPAPTLDDVARLTPESDYAAFTAPGVDERVRNEALRKLFHGNPHFQQSDGLDVAIDEVVELAQSPLARQQKIRQARAMGLLDDELLDQQAPDTEPPAGAQVDPPQA